MREVCPSLVRMLARCRCTVCWLITSSGRDLPVAQPLRHEAQHLALARRERTRGPAPRPRQPGLGRAPAPRPADEVATGSPSRELQVTPRRRHRLPVAKSASARAQPGVRFVEAQTGIAEPPNRLGQQRYCRCRRPPAPRQPPRRWQPEPSLPVSSAVWRNSAASDRAASSLAGTVRGENGGHQHVGASQPAVHRQTRRAGHGSTSMRPRDHRQPSGIMARPVIAAG